MASNQAPVPTAPQGGTTVNPDGSETDARGNMWQRLTTGFGDGAKTVYQYLGNISPTLPFDSDRADNEHDYVSDGLWNALRKVQNGGFSVIEVWKIVDEELDIQLNIHEKQTDSVKVLDEPPFKDLSMPPAQMVPYFDTRNASAGSLMLSEFVIVKSLVRYNKLTSSIARARYSKMYHALKDHFRVFFRDSYNFFQKLHWAVANRTVSWMMTNNYVQQLGELRDMVVTNVTLGPAVLGQTMINTFKARVLKTAPEELGGNRFLIAALAVVSGLALVGELLISRRTGSYTNLVAYLVEELNKMVIKSSYRYRNVLRLFIRMMSGMGAERTSYIVQALGYLQTPSESFAAFAKIPTFANVDDILQRGAGSRARRSGLRKYVYGLMDELDKGRDLHRASTGWSKLHFNVTGG